MKKLCFLKLEKRFKKSENPKTSNLDNIGRIETGNTNPTIRTLYKISQALKVKLKDLVNVE